VSLREIEVLVEKHQLVAEAVAIPVPHEFYGEDFVLAIIMKDDQNQELLSDVAHWLHENLVTYKWPQRIVFCKDFPRTGSGKIIKSKILNKFE
jgi:fatty-acyl-CoA synthase